MAGIMKTIDVVLKIPEGLNYQLAFRVVRDAPFDIEARSDARFVLAAGPGDLFPCLSQALGVFGLSGTVKAFAKLCTAKRMLYFTLTDNNISHYGWINIGFCRGFHIEPNEVFIGPIETPPKYRGHGLATFAMKHALNALLQRGFKIVYGNAQWDNHASIKVMEKCGFGAPVTAYLKGKDE